MFYGFLSIMILIVCVLLILVVLVQNSKGGGLASNFASSNQIMGVRRTADFLEKATWTLASVLLVFSVLASWAIPKKGDQDQSKMNIENSAPANFNPNNVPSIPTGQPNNQQGTKPANQQPVGQPAQQPSKQTEGQNNKK